MDQRKIAMRYRLTVDKLGPADPLDAMEMPEVPDQESLRDFFKLKLKRRRLKLKRRSL